MILAFQNANYHLKRPRNSVSRCVQMGARMHCLKHEITNDGYIDLVWHCATLINESFIKKTKLIQMMHSLLTANGIAQKKNHEDIFSEYTKVLTKKSQLPRAAAQKNGICFFHLPYFAIF